MSKIVSNDSIMDMFKEIDDMTGEIEITEKRKEIVERISFLVYGQAKPYRNFSNYEDLVQEGFVGLLKAVEKFKWRMFPNFFIYSGQWIRHYIKRSASRFDVVYNPNKTRVVYAEPNELEVDLSDSPYEILFAVEREEGINMVLAGLSNTERQIISMIFGLDGQKQETLRKIGPKFNVTYERIRQIKNNALVKLKRNPKMSEFDQI